MPNNERPTRPKQTQNVLQMPIQKTKRRTRMIKKLIQTWLALIIINTITMIILNELELTHLITYNTILTITYTTYIELQKWAKKTYIKLLKMQNGETTEEETKYLENIKNEIQKANQEK